MGNKHVDFISKLPLELVSAYIVPLVLDGNEWHTRNPCPYLQVSSTWRDRFSRANLHFLFNDHGNMGYPQQAFPVLHRIQSLKVLNYKPRFRFGKVITPWSFCIFTVDGNEW